MFHALQCPSSGARQTAVAASGFRMNVEVEVFSAVVGLLVCRSLEVIVDNQRVYCAIIRRKVFVRLFVVVVFRNSTGYMVVDKSMS
jgi:hypothetical protein